MNLVEFPHIYLTVTVWRLMAILSSLVRVLNFACSFGTLLLVDACVGSFSISVTHPL